MLEGDSGSWVVHTTAAELYGHVVATNIFGKAYVMPAVNVLKNMRECLGATSVALPSVTDLPFDLDIPNLPGPRLKSKAQYWKTPIQQAPVIKPREVLRKAKEWSIRFLKHKAVHDRPYVETSNATSLSSDILKAFLSDDSHGWETQVMQKFFNEAGNNHKDISEHIYLDYKRHYEENGPGEWFSPTDNQDILKRSSRLAVESKEPNHRRVM